jgi:antibiotic biosynthesis monooxygenase (ABM) superfamily enzyme
MRPDMVTSVIRHEVETGKEREYETWLQRIIPVAASFPGHRGVDVIPPPSGSQTYTIAIRFDPLRCAGLCTGLVRVGRAQGAGR